MHKCKGVTVSLQTPNLQTMLDRTYRMQHQVGFHVTVVDVMLIECYFNFACPLGKLSHWNNVDSTLFHVLCLQGCNLRYMLTYSNSVHMIKMTQNVIRLILMQRKTYSLWLCKKYIVHASVLHRLSGVKQITGCICVEWETCQHIRSIPVYTQQNLSAIPMFASWSYDCCFLIISLPSYSN